VKQKGSNWDLSFFLIVFASLEPFEKSYTLYLAEREEFKPDFYAPSDILDEN